MTKKAVPWYFTPYALGAYVLIALLLYTGTVKLPVGAIGQGSCLLTLSQMDVQSSNPNVVAGKVWVGLINFANCGQVARATFPTSELKSTDPIDKEVPKETVDMTFTMEQQAIKWNLQNTNNHLYELRLIPVNFQLIWQTGIGSCTYNVIGDSGARPDNFPSGTCSFGVSPPSDTQFAGAYQQYCPGTAVYKNIFINPNNRNEWYCYNVQKNDLGNVYKLINPYVYWKASFTVDPASKNPEFVELQSEAYTQGKTQPANVQGTSTGRDVFVNWVGNFVANNLIPSGNEPDVLLSPTNSFKKIGNTATYPIPVMVNPTDGTTYDSVSNAVTSYNTATQLILVSSANPEFSSASFDSAILTGNVLNPGNKLVLDVTANPRYFPSFQIITNALWMGMYIPKPIPQVVSVQPVAFTSGGYGTVVATVKNIGDQGSFSAFVTCPAPISVAGATQPIGSFAAGEQRTVNFAVVGSPVTTTATVQCTLTVYDANDQTNKAVASFSATVSPSCKLQPYGNYIIQTNPDGSCQPVCGITQSSCSPGQNLVNCQCLGAGVSPSPVITPSASPQACTPAFQTDPATGLCACLAPNVLSQAADGSLVCTKKEPGTGTDYTMYIIGGVVVILLLVAFYLQFGGKRKRK